jgi:hypothetical protein
MRKQSRDREGAVKETTIDLETSHFSVAFPSEADV